MVVNPMLIKDDYEFLFYIYSFGFFLGTISAKNNEQAAKSWSKHVGPFYWKDLRADKLLPS